jgi:PadR family transcriptional regulator, regulatory protein PadR
MRGMRGETVKGHLDLLLLSALEPSPAHGYLLIERLREQSEGAFSFPEGTIYPALHRLEEGALLSSRWADDSPRRRRVYELTPRGREELRRRVADWDRFASAVSLVVAGAR